MLRLHVLLACQRSPAFRRERFALAMAVIDHRGERKKALGRAFDDEDVFGLALGEDSERSALEVEGRLVEFCPALNLSIGAMVDDGLIERAANAAAEAAVDHGEGERPVAVRAVRARVSDQRDVGFGQRSGLVGAEHVHRPEVMDGGEPLHDDGFLGHADCPARQGYRHDHWQQFRGEADRQRDREQEGIQRRTAGRQVHEKDEQHEKGRQPHDQHAQAMNAPFERAWRFA